MENAYMLLYVLFLRQMFMMRARARARARVCVYVCVCVRVCVTEAELKQQGTNWTGMARAAQGTVRWRGVVDSLCFTGSDGHKQVIK